MDPVRRVLEKTLRGPVPLLGGAVALLSLLAWPTNGYPAPFYDDGGGSGCVTCHSGFVGGSGPLHTQHRNLFGATSCNVCHPSGGGSTPVRTYWSGSGGGFGCAGCHGQDYGEISPNSGEPKATAYGLRQVHVNAGITSCGPSGCHQPGLLGHSNPFPPLFEEHVAPPYYGALFSNLRDPCSSGQEDLPFDLDSVGLDNDGNGFADWPADPNCPEPAPTPTPGPFDCGTAPAMGCIPPKRAVLLVDEKTPGKEKLKVRLASLQTNVGPTQLGNPVSGSTAYKVCIYDATNALKGEYTVAQAGATCGSAPCWSAVFGKGYKYRDKSALADGILKMNLFGGSSGKGKLVIVGRNKSATMPTGVAAALQNESSATVQILTSNASCFGLSLSQVKKADGSTFKAKGP